MPAMTQQTISSPIALEHEPYLVQPVQIRYLFWKRIVDIVGAAFFLILALPFFIVTALAVKLTSVGPIFYTSYRIGLGGRRFKFVKLRSMYVDADRRLAWLPNAPWRNWMPRPNTFYWIICIYPR